MKCNYKVQNFEDIAVCDLIERIKEFKEKRHRLAQICATDIDGGIELIYSFDKDHELFNLKTIVKEGEKLESITEIYWPAFIYENELHDLFGIEFMNSKLDYNGKFFKLSEQTPWRKKNEGGT